MKDHAAAAAAITARAPAAWPEPDANRGGGPARAGSVTTRLMCGSWNLRAGGPTPTAGPPGAGHLPCPCDRICTTPAGHPAQMAGGPPDPAGPGPVLPPGSAGTAYPGAVQPAAAIAVVYDGCWYRYVCRALARRHGARLSPAGLRDAIRWYAAGALSVPVQSAVITEIHYVTGRTGTWTWDQKTDEYGVTRHDVPVTPGKGEVGADVELALTCYQIASETRVTMIALLAGDGDFAPLVARLAARGVRVLIPRTDLTGPAPDKGTPAPIATSAWLTRHATDTPRLDDLLSATLTSDYPSFLARPFPDLTTPHPGPPVIRHGTVTSWNPGAAHGFLACEQGRTWLVDARETSSRTALPPGSRVTFTAAPGPPPPGSRHPAARDVRPVRDPPASLAVLPAHRVASAAHHRSCLATGLEAKTAGEVR
jgi:hypothetical protein